MKKMDSLRSTMEQSIQRKIILHCIKFIVFVLASSFRPGNNRSLIPTNEIIEVILFTSDEFLKE